MLKKKICQLLAAVMITTTVMGSNVHVVWATERTDVIDVQSFSEKKFNRIYWRFNIINRYKHG